MNFNFRWQLRRLNILSFEDWQKCFWQINKVAVTFVNFPSVNVLCIFIFIIDELLRTWSFLVKHIDFEFDVFPNFWILPSDKFYIERILTFWEFIIPWWKRFFCVVWSLHDVLLVVVICKWIIVLRLGPDRACFTVHFFNDFVFVCICQVGITLSSPITSGAPAEFSY